MQKFYSCKVETLNDSTAIKSLIKNLNNYINRFIEVPINEWENRLKTSIGYDCFYYQEPTKINFLCKYHGKLTWFRFDRDGEYLTKETGMLAYRAFSKVYKVPTVDNAKDLGSAKPLLEMYNKKGGAVKAHDYDLSAAYLQMLKEPLPDMDTMRRNSVIGDGEVGFTEVYVDEQLDLDCSFVKGDYADYVFKLMDSPYVDYLEALEEEIQKAKNNQSKFNENDLKNRYRFFVGYLQKKNPFWRAIIVQRCNQEVSKYIDKYTLYANTDGFVSTREVDFSNSKYKWVEKHHEDNTFKWLKNMFHYQWGSEQAKIKGMGSRYSKWFLRKYGRTFDILTDTVPDDLSAKYSIEIVQNKVILRENKKYE